MENIIEFAPEALSEQSKYFVTTDEAATMRTVFKRYGIPSLDFCDFEDIAGYGVSDFVSYIPHVVATLCLMENRPTWVQDWVRASSYVLHILQSISGYETDLLNLNAVLIDAERAYLIGKHNGKIKTKTPTKQGIKK